ncbi:hypothetical protein LBMAG37_02910 [Anaerolineae bacterium]|nr:hypothetical protein EMGBD1_07510 [Anaerolineaceae bacterium]GDX67137.1 hypothetical protein LBMAG37_02910 [Anaerolineae bacterium]
MTQVALNCETSFWLLTAAAVLGYLALDALLEMEWRLFLVRENVPVIIMLGGVAVCLAMLVPAGYGCII